MATAITVGNVGVRQPRVVSAQLTIGVGRRTEPAASSRTPGNTEFHTVVLTNCRNRVRTSWAERNGIQVVSVSAYARTRKAGRRTGGYALQNRRAVQNVVSERRTRVSNVETE